MKKYMVAFDGSECSERALNRTLEIMGAEDKVLIVSIVEAIPETSAVDGVGWPSLEKKDEDSVIHGRIEKTQHMQHLLDKKLENVKHEMITDVAADPRDGLLAVSKREEVDMIVMGSRGLSFFSRMFLGSTSHYCVNHSKIPVLVVPPNSH